MRAPMGTAPLEGGRPLWVPYKQPRREPLSGLCRFRRGWGLGGVGEELTRLPRAPHSSLLCCTNLPTSCSSMICWEA